MSQINPEPRTKIFTIFVYGFALIGVVSTVLWILLIGGLMMLYAAFGDEIRSFLGTEQDIEYADEATGGTLFIGADSNTMPAYDATDGMEREVIQENLSTGIGTQDPSTITQEPTLIESLGISESQMRLLGLAGIDVNELPDTMTSELEACLVQQLGEKTYRGIINGTMSAGLSEVLAARSCL